MPLPRAAMAFVDELKQRKVVRVAVAYLIAAWLGVQVASIALPAFEAPGWVLRVLMLVMALGFPLALILTWAIDLTPDGPRYSPGGVGRKRMFAISAGLGVLALGWYFLGQPAWREDKPGAANSAAASPSKASDKPAVEKAAANERSIAVLPFVNMSGDPANDYFSDGLAETTLDMLAQVHDLKVIARTSSFAFKGKNSDVREIGRKLDAAHLLEGSVQQAGKTVRITAQLIRAHDGVHLWSHRYDRQLTDVFKIQDEIAGEVVKALQLALPAAEQKRLTGKRTENVAAYQEYLRGNALLPNRRMADMRKALAHFERAIELDPGYAAAYSSASMTLALLSSYGGELDSDETARRTRYIEKALQLDPGLGEAYATRASLREQQQDVKGAEEDYRRATELAPNFASGFQWYGEFLTNQLGEAERALPLLERAVKLDPLSPVIQNEYVSALATIGQFDRALALNTEMLHSFPDYAGAYQLRARLFQLKGDMVETLRAWDSLRRIDPEATKLQMGRCETLQHFGALAEALACLDDLDRRSGSPQSTLNLRTALRVSAGDYDGALKLMARVQTLEPWGRVWRLLATDHPAEALKILQEIDPGMFIQPVPKLTSNYSWDAVAAGAALIGTGATVQGRDLLQRAIKDNARHPIVQLQFGRGWNDAIAWSLLGDQQRACASLREAVASGYTSNLEDLDAFSYLKSLRAQPCYQQALAPARARNAAQVAAARKAGLL
ncbi:MAG: hypothetical protein KAY03_04450 [Arenimonas sp.]|nr:hypothetical protein [Arenimonas sp.]